MDIMSFDFERKQRIAIIGGGPGGYEAALAGAQLGAEVTIVECTGVGGSAVLTDVVPSKTLIATADAARAIEDAGDLGVQFFARGEKGKPLKPEVAINLLAINKRILALAGQQSEDMRERLLEEGVTIISGYGRLEGDDAIVVSTGPEGTDFDRIEADTIIVSVGASPRELPTAKPDGDRILTWKQMYNMSAVPEH
ncbi:MAG: FAD-dependent oxidoreductase, partial [Microbacterium gubbeenense]